MSDFLYDLPRLLSLKRVEDALARAPGPRLHEFTQTPVEPRAIAVLSGSFNPLTRGHEALVAAALREGAEAVLLLLPLRAVDKEGVTRASAADRLLVLLQWAGGHEQVRVALINRGLYVEHAVLLAQRYPSSAMTFVVGHDKIVQIFDPRYYEAREEALDALFAYATLRVAPRLGAGRDALQVLLNHDSNRRYAPHVTPLSLDASVAALSSTAVRRRVRAGEPWEDLVPAETAQLIHETAPFSPPIVLPGGEHIDAYGLRQALLAAIIAGHLDASTADFAALCHVVCSSTAAGHRLRRWLAGEEGVGYV